MTVTDRQVKAVPEDLGLSVVLQTIASRCVRVPRSFEDTYEPARGRARTATRFSLNRICILQGTRAEAADPQSRVERIPAPTTPLALRARSHRYHHAMPPPRPPHIGETGTGFASSAVTQPLSRVPTSALRRARLDRTQDRKQIVAPTRSRRTRRPREQMKDRVRRWLLRARPCLRTRPP